MIRVAVSILNHNSAESTIACVQSLLVAEKFVQDICKLEMYVSDNASGHEDQSQLQSALSEIDYVKLRLNAKNIGFSAGHNRNLEAIFANSSPDYVWLLNNDCIVAEQALGALLGCAQNRSDIGIWGSTLLESDGETIQCAGGCFYNSWISSYRQYGTGRPLDQVGKLKPKKYDYISGASMFFPVSTLQSGINRVPRDSADEPVETHNWLNETFFLYFEELDLAKRLKAGLGLGWCREALIRHTGGAGTGAHANQRSVLAEYHSTLSALNFTQQYYPRRLWIVALFRYLAKCVQLSGRGDFRLIGVMTKAYLDSRRSA